MTKAGGVLFVALGLVGGCAHVPRNPSERAALHDSAQSTVQEMTAQAPTLRPMLDGAAGYVVFPVIKQGGFVVGGAGGTGIAYQNGRAVGYAELRQAAIGALAGGQKFSEMIVVRDPQTFERMRGGKFNVGAQASAVVIRAGAGTATQFGPSGVAVFIHPRGGAMVNASLTGQSLKIRQH